MPYNRLQDIKTVVFVQSQAIKDDAAFVGAQGATPVSVDTKGWNEARVVFAYGASDIALAAINVFDSDDDSTYTEIPGLDHTTAGDGTTPSATEDNSLFMCHIDLKNKKRYLQIALTAGDGTAGSFAAAWVDLAKGETEPSSVTERGALRELFA